MQSSLKKKKEKKKEIIKYKIEGTTPLERSGTATRGGLAGDGRAVTTLLWIDGSPSDLHGRGDPRGYTGTGTVRPGQSGEGRTGVPDCGEDRALMKTQEPSKK